MRHLEEVSGRISSLGSVTTSVVYSSPLPAGRWAGRGPATAQPVPRCRSTDPDRPLHDLQLGVYPPPQVGDMADDADAAGPLAQ